jgi:hypothetical protein
MNADDKSRIIETLRIIIEKTPELEQDFKNGQKANIAKCLQSDVSLFGSSLFHVGKLNSSFPVLR